MSRHLRGSGAGTAWLVADQENGDHLCYSYTGESGDRLEEQARAATLAVGGVRVRSSRLRIGMPNHRTYWAGTAQAPPRFAGTWAEDAQNTAKHGFRGGGS